MTDIFLLYSLPLDSSILLFHCRPQTICKSDKDYLDHQNHKFKYEQPNIMVDNIGKNFDFMIKFTSNECMEKLKECYFSGMELIDL